MVTMTTNSLCKLIDILYNISQAGIAGQTTAELVYDVFNACGLGILGTTRKPSSTLNNDKKNTLVDMNYDFKLLFSILEFSL